MKTAAYFLLAVGFAGMWSGCEEIPPDISFTCETDRVLLVEEFTGVKCVNCPAGTEKIEELSDQYPGQIVAVSIHAGFFSKPFDTSPEDFTTADGEAIDAWAGPATGWPAAMINRRVFTGESSRVLGLNAWAGKIAQELCEEPIASVNINSSYDTASRQATIIVNGGALSSDVVNEAVALTVMITESGINAPQTTPETSKDTTYIHKHVLRDVVTDVQGKDILTGSGTIPTYQETFNYTLPAHWVPSNCHVVAFLHFKTGSNLRVLQAAEADLE